MVNLFCLFIWLDLRYNHDDNDDDNDYDNDYDNLWWLWSMMIYDDDVPTKLMIKYGCQISEI